MTISENESELFVEILHKTYANHEFLSHFSHEIASNCFSFGRKHPDSKQVGNEKSCLGDTAGHMDPTKQPFQCICLNTVASGEVSPDNGKARKVHKHVRIPSVDLIPSSPLRLKYSKTTQTHGHAVLRTIVYNDANLASPLNMISIPMFAANDIYASFTDSHHFQIGCVRVKKDLCKVVSFSEELMLINTSQYNSTCECARLQKLWRPRCLNAEFYCSQSVTYESNTSRSTLKKRRNEHGTNKHDDNSVFDDSSIMWSKKTDHIGGWVLSQNGGITHLGLFEGDHSCNFIKKITVSNSSTLPIFFARSFSIRVAPKIERVWKNFRLYKFNSQSLSGQWSLLFKPVQATFQHNCVCAVDGSQNSFMTSIPRFSIYSPTTDFWWIVRKFSLSLLREYFQFVNCDTTNSNRQNVSKSVTYVHQFSRRNSLCGYGVLCNKENKRQSRGKTTYYFEENERNIGMQASLTDSVNKMGKNILLECPLKGCFTFHTENGKIFTYISSTRIRTIGHLLKYLCEIFCSKELDFCSPIRCLERLVAPACVYCEEPKYTIVNLTWMCEQLPVALRSSPSMNRRNLTVSQIKKGIQPTEHLRSPTLYSNRNYFRFDTCNDGRHTVPTFGPGRKLEQRIEKPTEPLLFSEAKSTYLEEEVNVKSSSSTDKSQQKGLVHRGVENAPGYFSGYDAGENSIECCMNYQPMQAQCTVELDSVSPVERKERPNILSNIDDIRFLDVFHEDTADKRIRSVELRTAEVKQRDCRTSELGQPTRLRKQTPYLRPSLGASETFRDNHTEDDGQKFRTNCSSHPDLVEKCGDVLNSRTPLHPSIVKSGWERDRNNKPTRPPSTSKHSSPETSGLTKAAGSTSSSPETRNTSTSEVEQQENNLSQKKIKNKRKSVKELLKRYERLTSKLIKTNQSINALYEEKQQKNRRINNKRTAESVHDKNSSEAFSDRKKQTDTVAVLEYLNRLRDHMLQTYGDALPPKPSQRDDEHSKKDVDHNADLQHLISLSDRPAIQLSVPSSVSSASDIPIKRNYSELLPTAFPSQRSAQPSDDPLLAHPTTPDSLQNMARVSSPSTGCCIRGTCIPVQSTCLTSSLPPASTCAPTLRSQSRSRHTSSRRSSHSVLDDNRWSHQRSRSRHKFIVEQPHPSAHPGAVCGHICDCPYRNKIPSTCCMTMIPSISNNHLNSYIPTSCLCPHSCFARSSIMEYCPHHAHPCLECVPTRHTVPQQSTWWPHGTAGPTIYHSPCAARETPQQAYTYLQPISHLQSAQQNPKMPSLFPAPYQIPADFSQTQQTTQVPPPRQTAPPMIRSPSTTTHSNTYSQTAHPPTPSFRHQLSLSEVTARQTTVPHHFTQTISAQPTTAFDQNLVPNTPNHNLQFDGFQKEISSKMHSDPELRNHTQQTNHEEEVSTTQKGKTSFHAPAQGDLKSITENQPNKFEHGGSKFVRNVTLNPNEVLSIPATHKDGVLDHVRIHIPRQILPERDHRADSSDSNRTKTDTLSPQAQQQQQQQQQQSQISPAPFRSVIARRANLPAVPSTPEEWKKVENRFDQLQREKTMLESKLCRLPVVAEEENINDDLSRVEKEMSALRLLMHRRFVENRRLLSRVN